MANLMGRKAQGNGRNGAGKRLRNLTQIRILAASIALIDFRS